MDVRIPPSPLADLGPLARLVSLVVGRVTPGGPPRIFTTLGRHRRLFRWWLPFAGTLLLRSRLDRADVELIVLRTAHNCGSPYEWAQHEIRARKAGLSDADIAALAEWWRSDRYTARQRLLLSATDELHRDRVVGDATWTSLAGELDEAALIELCMLVGHYEMLAMTLNSLGVAPETPRGLARLSRDVRPCPPRKSSRMLGAWRHLTWRRSCVSSAAQER